MAEIMLRTLRTGPVLAPVSGMVKVRALVTRT